MKKFFATLLAAFLVIAAVNPVTAKAGGLLISPKPADVTVYVTICDGDVKLAQTAVKVADIDEDGALTINDALYLAHEAEFKGGAAAGYGSANSTWGLSLTKLWGVENGGSYGYYVNNVSAMGLADPIKNGDYINAFVYTDTVGFSDKYTFFDVYTVEDYNGKDVTLTLSGAGYDANWNPVTVQIADATVTVDGKKTTYKTDANGKVTLKVDKKGSHVISAVSDTETLVPAVCVISAPVKVNPPLTADTAHTAAVVFLLVAIGGVAACVFCGKKVNER